MSQFAFHDHFVQLLLAAFFLSSPSVLCFWCVFNFIRLFFLRLDSLLPNKCVHPQIITVLLKKKEGRVRLKPDKTFPQGSHSPVSFLALFPTDSVCCWGCTLCSAMPLLQLLGCLLTSLPNPQRSAASLLSPFLFSCLPSAP